ncbi:hypothetical protein BGX28_000952, partial [Mortierella sp. GBA30]
MDNDSVMDPIDHDETLANAATNLQLGNVPAQVPSNALDGLALNMSMTDQEFLDCMYEKRDRLVNRMRTASRLQIASGGTSDANKRSYEEAKQLLHDLESLLLPFEDALKRKAKSSRQRLSLEELHNPAPEPKKGNDHKIHTAHQLKINDDMPRFYPDSDPREFLDQLKHIVMPYVGKEAFEASCDRYLRYLTVSEFHQQSLDYELNKKKKEGVNLTWEECEMIFLRVSLSEQERIAQIKQLLETGRKDHESYRQFAMRISRDIRVYGIKDDNEMVLSLLSATVTPDTLNLMVTRLQVLKQNAEVRFLSINDFTKIMSNLIGPLGTYDKKSYGSISIKDHRRVTGPYRLQKKANAARFSPKIRQQEPNITPRSMVLKPMTHNCAACGPNRSHNTADCIGNCTHCGKKGHSFHN